jgi:hypothetical protein
MHVVRVVRLLAAALGVGLAIAQAALAGWSAPVSLGPVASTPVIGFDPAGNAALAFAGSDGTIYVVRHPRRGAFSAAAGVAGFSEAPSQVVLTGDGATVLRAGSTMFVQPAGSTTFAPPQQLGGPQQFDLTPADAVIAPTSVSDVIASISDNSLQEETAVLAPGAAAFGPGSWYRRFYPIGGPAPIAMDAAGGAFITDESTERCRKGGEGSIVVAYRSAHGAFRVTTPLRCLPLVVPDSPPSMIAAAGNGQAVLATVAGKLNHYEVLVQLRGGARFGPPRLLAKVHPHSPSLLGPPIIGQGGAVTLAWESCSGSLAHCIASAAHGSADGHVWRTRTFTAPANRFGIGVPQVGDGYVILSRCAGSSCVMSASYADASGRFGNPQQITGAGEPAYPDQLAAASGGRRRLGLFIWVTPAGGIFATTISSRTHRFGPPTRLAPDGTATPGKIDYELGPNEQAIVAWVNGNGTASGAVYSP